MRGICRGDKLMMGRTSQDEKRLRAVSALDEAIVILL